MKADQLSKTAAFIAIKFYGLTNIDSYRTLFDPTVIQFYEKLVQSLPLPLGMYHNWLKYSWVRKVYIWWEELLLPGDLMHVLARKFYIRRMADQLIDQGYEQMVVLGAGFDHLAHHFSQQGIACFEIDAPYMASYKRSFLKKAFPTTPQPTIMATHFPIQNFGELLQSREELDPDKKTIIIAEGFFDYLTSHTVDSTITTLKEYFSHNFTIISTHFSLNELSTFHRFVYKTSVNMVGEMLRLDHSLPEMEHLFNKHQLSFRELIDRQQISDELFAAQDSPFPVLKGFYIFRASPEPTK